MTLVDLKRSFWKRNSLHKNTNKGQLIYGDALYLREPESLLEDYFDEERLVKALTIYLAYGYSDLAISLIESALSRNIISAALANQFLSSIVQEFTIPNFKGKRSLKSVLDFVSKHLNENTFSAQTDKKLGN